MPEPQESELIREFRDLVARGEVRGLGVRYRVSGGMPGETHQHVNEELSISGMRRARIRAERPTGPPQEVAASLGDEELREVFREVGEAVGELIPRSEARFLPDSLVGCVVIEVHGREAALFFLADEEERSAQQKPISPRAVQALERVSRLSRRLLTQRG